MRLATRGRPIAIAVLGLLVAACQPTAPTIDMTDPRVTAGATRSCAELELSAVRCTLVTLRATTLLDEQRPDHGRIESQALHEAAGPAAGQSPLPEDLDVAAVVVFTLEGGRRVGVPVVCPRGSTDASDPACDVRTQ